MQGWPTFIAAPLALVAPATHASVYLSIEQAQQAIFPGAKFIATNIALTETQARQIAERSGARTRGRDQRVWEVAGAGWFFVDESPNHSRLWCSSEVCGNRERARRAYAKRRPKAVRRVAKPA